MSNDRRPTRPGQKPTTGGFRPPTQRVTPAAGVRPATTRMTPGRGTPQPPPPAPANNQPLIIGACIAGAVVLILGLMMMGGSAGEQPRSTSTKARPPSTASAAPKKVDVSALIRDGQQKCEEGYLLITGCETLINEYHRSGAGSDELKGKLKRGLELIASGNQCFSEAQEKSNGEQGFSDKKYNEAAYAARKIVSELK